MKRHLRYLFWLSTGVGLFAPVWMLVLSQAFYTILIVQFTAVFIQITTLLTLKGKVFDL